MEEDEKKEDVILTEEEVWNVVEFARSYGSGYGLSYLNPELINARMRDITLNPMAATQDMLDKAMVDPKQSEKQLQSFSQNFELTSMVYKRLMSYLGNMLAFDITYTSDAEDDDYKTPKYKKDLTVAESFIDRFDYQKEFGIVVREMLRNDAYFGCVRSVGSKVILQELPPEYCKITGRWENGFLFSFNMYWFLQPGVDIDMYPKFFKKKYNELWGNSNKINDYNPHLPPELRSNSSWIYWVDIPVDFGICFKLTPELATRLPYFTPLFNDLVLQGLMRNLQKNINMSVASRMILGEVPLLNKESKATVKDSIAISPDLLGKFLGLVKSAIGDSIKIASAPLTNMKGVQFDSDNALYDSYLRTALASSGINTNLIFSSSVKPNAVETQLSLNVDEQLMTSLYRQFNDFMDYQINRLTRTFKFHVEFEGTQFFLERDSRIKQATDMFNLGIVMPQKIAAALGMKPSALRKHMAESKDIGFMNLITPPTLQQQLVMADVTQKNAEAMAEKTAKLAPKPAPPAGGGSTASKPASKPAAKPAAKTPTKAPAKPEEPKKSEGRPKKTAGEISEEGMKTRETGANIGRGGKA